MVELDPGAPESPDKTVKKKEKNRNVWISFVGRIVAQIIGAVASVVLGIFVLQQYQSRPAAPPDASSAPVAVRTPGQQSIAVLPLDNFSANSEDAYFADGMTEVLIADLAQLKGWRVISRTSTEAYRKSQKPLTQIAQELNVDLIVEGSVTKAGDRVRVTVQLIDAKSDEHLFARSYDRTMKDVLALQGTLATEIAKSMKASIAPEQESRFVQRAAFDPAVYDLYLRGRHAWNLRTPEGLASAIKLFGEAVAREPNFALAHVGLADAFILGGSPSTGPADAKQRMARAKASAERALAIADHLAEAHTAMGGVLFFGERDAAGAERAFRRAIALNANYPIAHQWLAILLAERGRDAEARSHADTAVSLDPLEATLHQARGLVHYYGRRYDDAIAAEQRALAIRPQLPFARVVLVKAQIMDGDLAAAVRSCDEAQALEGGQTDLILTCGIALRRQGDARAAHAWSRLTAMKPLPEPAIAQWHAATGDLPRAVELLARLRQQGNVPPNIEFDPLFEPLRVDPRYAELVAGR